MPEGIRGRLIVAVIVLLAVADAVFWVYLFKRSPAKSTYVSRVTSAAPTPSPTPKASALPPLPLPQPGSRPLTVSIVGDSIAEGHFVSNPYASFRTLMLNALQARGSVQPQQPVPAPADGKLADMAVTVPSGMDLVVLEVGSADVARTDPTTFNAAYAGLVKQVRATSPNAALVCAGTWSANGRAFDTVIARQCVSARGNYVPLNQLYAVSTNHDPAGTGTYYGVTDGIAPNDAGHRAIAAALLKPIGVALP